MIKKYLTLECLGSTAIPLMIWLVVIFFSWGDIAFMLFITAFIFVICVIAILVNAEYELIDEPSATGWPGFGEGGMAVFDGEQGGGWFGDITNEGRGNGLPAIIRANGIKDTFSQKVNWMKEGF